VPDVSVWRAMAGLDDRTVIERVAFEEGRSGRPERLVLHVRPSRRKGEHDRCGRCGRRSPGYDGGRRREWRSVNCGLTQMWLAADAPRVRCAEHGVTVARVPWARHGAGHTRVFDAQVAWLAVRTSKSTVRELLRIAWKTVGSVIDRVWADISAEIDLLDGVRRIGIDEVSYKKNHRYLTIVVDHDTGRVVWAAAGRNAATLSTFFDELGPERTAALTHVSADAAHWIASTVRQRAPQAILCADPFHIVAWATDAIDTVRRQEWRALKALADTERAEQDRRVGRPTADDPKPQTPRQDLAREFKTARYSLLKNPDNLTQDQSLTLKWITAASPRLHEAYAFKEKLRIVFQARGKQGKRILDAWVKEAGRSTLEPIQKLCKSVVRIRASIEASLQHGLSQGLIESTNTKIRLFTRMAFGFHTPQALIALVMLNLGGPPLTLPGRT
jgi:transposase